MSTLGQARLGPGDLVAVALPPGRGWPEIVAETWGGGAALFPVDHRMPPSEARALLDRARPTVLLDGEGSRRLAGVGVDPGVALVVHTSGTGGVPKLVEFDRGAIDAAIASSALALGATSADAWICCLPLAHVGGLLALLRGVLLGAPVHVHPAFDPAAVARERGAAFISVVPTMLVRLLEHGAGLAHLRAILVGGAHLSPDLRARAERSGARVIETYGLTESCGGVVYEGVPLPGTRMRIDAAGGIELRGPTVMRGYRFDAAATAEAFTPDGWLRPGDAGEIDAAGRLHVVGRVDDLILTGGEKVWPDEVEAVLRVHPKIREVAVGARLDHAWGQRVAAWVVPADPADPPTLHELRGFASMRIARHKAPRELVLVDEIPRTFSGKVRRAALASAGAARGRE
ncbi:MAG TPA: fatty acid--CoA ligase family protein [Actinomycetota bacterium]|nr:fatty acid--CoA ligase family protein [Actinomycetota bacterium]